jgi:hypothetical protein
VSAQAGITYNRRTSAWPLIKLANVFPNFSHSDALKSQETAKL